MSSQLGASFAHSADYEFINTALKARWLPFTQLVSHLNEFTPRTRDDFADYRAKELHRLKGMNPHSTDDDLLKLIDQQITAHADPGLQVWIKFADPVMAEYVTVALLAHALCEAVINAILAIGLAGKGSAELFTIFERADVREKWVSAPKALHSEYTFPKHTALYETLHHLIRERNAFVHYKIELEMNGERQFHGSRLNRAPLGTQIAWIHRFFSLPYDLASHARAQLPALAPFLLHESQPIERFKPHTGT